jgi:hypothetical protein
MTPKVYAKPWTFKQNHHLTPDTELMDYICNENEKDGGRRSIRRSLCYDLFLALWALVGVERLSGRVPVVREEAVL